MSQSMQSVSGRICGVLVIMKDQQGSPKLVYMGDDETSPLPIAAANATPALTQPATVAAPVIETPAPAAPETPAPKKRGGGRRKKAEPTTAPAPTVKAPEPTPAPTPAAETPKPTKGKKGKGGGGKGGGFKRDSKFRVWLPLSQCCGVARYQGKNSTGNYAIVDVLESAKDGRRYVLAFITKDEKPVKNAKGEETGESELHAYWTDSKDWTVADGDSRLLAVKLAS